MRISDWSSDVCSSDLLAGCDGAPTARVTAYTISLGTPGAMAEQAATAAADGYRLLKIKLTGEDDRLRVAGVRRGAPRSEEHTSELQSLMRISYAVFCLKKKKKHESQQHGDEEDVIH